jgi:anthranilate synthase component 2
LLTVKTLLLDNYDSFTYNLFQLLAEVNGEEPIVVRNDEYDWPTLAGLPVDNAVISPGPGTPVNVQDFGVCRDALRQARIPLLGVCLGHQGLALAAGAQIIAAPEVMHGRQSQVFHDGSALFASIPQGFSAMRYHSLVVARLLPPCLQVTAWTEDGTIMGLRHTERPLWGVQFHPESIGTEHGKEILANFREITRRWKGDPPRSL